jgi:hypothetical protein
MLNVGILASSSLSDYYVFHDSDLLPYGGVNYDYQEEPTDLTTLRCHYTEPMSCAEIYAGMGGVSTLNRHLAEEISGWSNLLFGWGGEDDEVSARCKFLGHPIRRIQGVSGAFWHIDGVVRFDAHAGEMITCVLSCVASFDR